MRRFAILVSCLILLLAAAPLFAASMDGRVRSINATLMEALFKEPEKNLPAVVKSLTGGNSGTAATAKVLHDWICDNIAYDTDVFDNPRIALEQDYASVLKKKKAICSGYTNLMNEMCRLAGVESIGITGYSKGFGYSGTIKKGQRPDHAWNAIRIGNRWQLVDVTWDAGFCDWKHFVRHYSTDYLYLTPEQFIFSHLPQDEQYQYLKKPVTVEEFVEQPYVPGKFFAQKLAFTKEMPMYTNSIEEAKSFDFMVGDPGIVVVSDVISESAGAFVSNASWVDRSAGRVTATFDVPDTGTYTARLATRRRGETMNPIHISVGEWESYIMPNAEGLLAQKKITQKEYDFLAASYIKVPENNRYYLDEDLFATARNSAVTKVLKLLSFNISNYDEVLCVKIKTGVKYKGYASAKSLSSARRFPLHYTSYADAQNIQLVLPREGILQKGSEQTFAVKTKDYTGLAYISTGGEWNYFKLNPASGCYELKITVPQDEDSLTIMGTKNGRQYEGLITYELR